MPWNMGLCSVHCMKCRCKERRVRVIDCSSITSDRKTAAESWCRPRLLSNPSTWLKPSSHRLSLLEQSHFVVVCSKQRMEMLQHPWRTVLECSEQCWRTEKNALLLTSWVKVTCGPSSSNRNHQTAALTVPSPTYPAKEKQDALVKHLHQKKATYNLH